MNNISSIGPYCFFSGLVLTLPCIDELRIVDIRTFFYDIQPQKVCTN